MKLRLKLPLVFSAALLLLLAGHLLDAGVRIAAWLDTGSLSQRLLSGAAMPAAGRPSWPLASPRRAPCGRAPALGAC